MYIHCARQRSCGVATLSQPESSQSQIHFISCAENGSGPCFRHPRITQHRHLDDVDGSANLASSPCHSWCARAPHIPRGCYAVQLDPRHCWEHPCRAPQQHCEYHSGCCVGVCVVYIGVGELTRWIAICGGRRPLPSFIAASVAFCRCFVTQILALRVARALGGCTALTHAVTKMHCQHHVTLDCVTQSAWL